MIRFLRSCIRGRELKRRRALQRRARLLRTLGGPPPSIATQLGALPNPRSDERNWQQQR